MVNLQSFIPSGNLIGSFVKVFLWGGGLAILIGIIAFAVRLKFKYIYRAEVFKRRQDYDNLPTSSVIYGIAGYFKKRSGKTVFRIRYGIRPTQVIELSKIPDPNYMIGNKVVYMQLNKDNFVQAKVDVDWTGDLKLEPVEDDLKFSAEMDINEKLRVLDSSKIKPVVVGMIIMGLIIVTGVIVFYFLGKA
ncbi:MAG TPA: hypothetical protein VMV95_00220 [Bacillota bacterium]|nr:hypothetical protein [Bacillota bacterium]